MATDLLEKERHLKQTSFGLEQAQAVAISGERALVDAGLLKSREARDGDGIEPSDAIEIPSEEQADPTLIPDPAHEPLKTTEEDSNAGEFGVNGIGVHKEQIGLTTPNAGRPDYTEATAGAAGDDHISTISGMLDSKEGNLVSALLSMAMAGRELDQESKGVKQAKKARQELQDRIDEIERNVAGCKDTNEELVQQSIAVIERELPGEKLRLRGCEEEVEYRSWRFEVMKERIVATCQDLCDSEADNLTDVSRDAKEFGPIKSLAEDDELWEMLDRYQHASWRTKVARQELDALTQQRSTIAKSAILPRKQFLSLRIASGIDANDVDPELDAMPGLCLANQMMQKEIDLRATL
jgi:hypothetical protein